MAFADKWMELENIMLSEISQSPKKQRLNVFPDKWRTLYNGSRGGELENNGGTLEYVEENEREGGMKKGGIRQTSLPYVHV